MHLANFSIAEAFKSLGSSEDGLASAEAARRLGKHGANHHIEKVGAEPQGLRFLREFTHFFAIILWVAAGLAFYAESRSRGEGLWQLGVAIVAVILINGCFSYWQEHPAERANDASALETKNVLLAGTSLVSGEGRAIVFATGMATEFGLIAHLTQTEDPLPVPVLQEALNISLPNKLLANPPIESTGSRMPVPLSPKFKQSK